MFYLDPHDAHPTTCADGPDFNDSTYFCDNIRYMPLANIDPTLALGLLCPTSDAFDEACSWIKCGNEANPTTVVLTVVETRSETVVVPHKEYDVTVLDDDDDNMEGGEAWELL